MVFPLHYVVFRIRFSKQKVSFHGRVWSRILDDQKLFYSLLRKNIFHLFLGLRSLRILAVYSGFKDCLVNLWEAIYDIWLRSRIEWFIMINKILLLSHSRFDLEVFDFLIKVNKDGLAKLLAQLLKMSYCKVNVFMFRSTERTLKRVDIAMLELLSQDSSWRYLFLVVVYKTAIFKGKTFKEFAD